MVATATPIQTPEVAAAGGRQIVPFRKATIERAETLPADTGTVTAGVQRIERTVEGAGFVYGIVLDCRVTTAGNAAGTTFAEDGPWSFLDSVVFRDVNGELVNLTGYDLLIANLCGAQYSVFFPTAATISSLFSTTTGAGATGGSFTFMIRVPVAINRRDLVGSLGNQDRAQKYSLRNDIAGTASIYGVAPTNPGAFVIDKFYENYAVPMPTGPQGQPQQSLPPSFGTFHYLTSVLSESAPIGGARANHYLRRIGNSIRFLALVWRRNGSRANAETDLATTTLRLKVGEDTLFNETYRYRRFLMQERYGFDFPAGVAVYDNMHDFTAGAGDELGDDYWHTQAVNNAQLEASYPASMGSTNNTLRIITDDLQPGGVGPMVG